MRPPVLEWRDVRKSFAGKPVLNGLDLTVEAGRSLVIMGGSGQGKSVALKLALGLMRPDSGQVRFERSDDFAFNTDLVTFRCVVRADGRMLDTTGAVKHLVQA